jgi:hypothetical protein
MDKNFVIWLLSTHDQKMLGQTKEIEYIKLKA